jgi:hypothetical protein
MPPAQVPLETGLKASLNRHVVEICGVGSVSDVEGRWIRLLTASGSSENDWCRTWRYLRCEHAAWLRRAPPHANAPRCEIRGIQDAFQRLLATPVEEALGLLPAGTDARLDNPVVLVSRVGKSIDFFRAVRIGEWPLSVLLACGKLDEDGRVVDLVPVRAAEQPSLIISPDLQRVRVAIESHRLHPRAVILGSPERAVDDLQSLDFILEAGLPVSVVSDDASAHHLAALRDDYGFRVWQWSSRLAADLASNRQGWTRTVFDKLNRFLGATETAMKPVQVRDEALESVVRDVERLRFVFRDRPDTEQKLYDWLWYTASDLARLVHVTSDEWRNARLSRLAEASELAERNM